MARKVRTVKKNVVVEKTAAKLPKKILLKGLVVLIVIGVVYFSFKLLVAASVNGQLIGRMSVIKELEKQNGKATLDTVILKTLISQEAKKRKVTVSQKEIDAEMQKIEANVASQGSTLDQLLAQQGMKKNELAGEIKIQLLVTKMVGDTVSVSDKEIDDYITSQAQQLAANPNQQLTRDQVKSTIKQQKLQQKIQAFVLDLKAKAKITYFVSY
jgi:foldase protein PrsA